MFKPKSLVFVAFTSILLLIDAITLLVPWLGFVGMMLHGIGIGILILYALTRLFSIARSSFHNKSYLTLLVIGIWVLFIGFWAQDSRSLSGEATVETTCAINHFINSQDRGLHQTCLYGYPARQYLPQAVASLLFGRSLVYLSWGGSVYFLSGLIIFSWSMFTILGRSKHADIFTAILLSVIFHFRYVNHALFHFEQSIFPFSLALIMTGVGITILLLKRFELIGLAGIVVILIAHSYPPALVLLVLVLMMSFGTTYKSPKVFSPMIWLATITILSVVLSLTYRKDVMQNNLTPTNLRQSLSDILDSSSHLLLNEHGESFFSPVIQGTVIVIFLSMLFMLHGYEVALIAAWSCGVILLSIAVKGYTNYSIDFRLHRAIVVIPPMLASFAYIIAPKFEKIPKKYFYFIFAITIMSGMLYSYRTISKRPMHPHFEIIKQLKFFETSEAQSLLVTEKAGLSDNLISLHDTAQYFLPSITVRNVNVDEIEYDNCARVSDSINLLLILASDKKCLRTLSNGKPFKITSPNLLESYVVWKPKTSRKL